MKHIKQITFDITQSRRIKNYAQKTNVKEKELLDKYKEVMHIVFQAWKKNHSLEEISFRTFFLTVMKYAEFGSRLKERHIEIETINNHVEILRDALDEYERDYEEIMQIEKIVNTLAGGYKP